MSAPHGSGNKTQGGRLGEKEIDPRHKWLYQRPSLRVNKTQRFEKPRVAADRSSTEAAWKRFDDWLFKSDNRVAKFFRLDSKRLFSVLLIGLVGPLAIPTIDYQVIQPVRKISSDFIDWVSWLSSKECREELARIRREK